MAICGVVPVAAIARAGIFGWHLPALYYRGTTTSAAAMYVTCGGFRFGVGCVTVRVTDG